MLGINLFGKRNIIYTDKTDKGSQRAINQDAIASFVQGDLGLFVLADGMGGHSAGELASGCIMDCVRRYWEQLTAGKVSDVDLLSQQIKDLILSANQLIWERYNQGQVCGSTVVVLLIKGDTYVVFSVGDSRLYTATEKGCGVLTAEDIWDNLPSTRKEFTPEQIRSHVNQGKLIQAVGAKPSVTVHMQQYELEKGQRFLLCSDGLFKFCPQGLVEDTLKQIKDAKTMEQAMELYFSTVFEQGAGDNVSVILVKAG